MADPLLLYSTNTYLAFNINRRYYKGLHYVWCSPFFSIRDPLRQANPPSSTPAMIYHRFLEDIQRGDLHSGQVSQNKTGLLKGVKAKRAKGEITPEAEADIEAIIQHAHLDLFTPIVYVMPFAKVKNLVQPVPIAERANPLSEEFLIPELPDHLFDVLDMRR